MYPSTSTQQPAAICALKSPVDAIHILEAVRLGLVPRVTRRLTGHERSMIRPGTVWVWEEEETNMRRWTDGRRWGASRVGGGGFLVYTESSDNLSPPPSRQGGTDYGRMQSGHAYTPYGRSSVKPESLIKQTYSTTMTHPATGKAKKFHVVAYSSKHNPQGDANNPLPLPQQLPLLSTLKITPGIWPEWEHRRDVDLTPRRDNSHPPAPSASQSAPVTATASPDGEHYNQQRGRSPQREAYTARVSPSQQQRYPPYPPPPQMMNIPRDSYGNRPMVAPYPPPDRYHPYHDPNRSRPYAPNSATSSVSTLPGPSPTTPQEMYYDDRRYNPQQHPRLSPNPGYPHPFDPYGRPYSRQYGDEQSQAPFYDPSQPMRSPEDKLRDAQYSNERHSAPTNHLPPPTVETTAPATSGRTSPKMSIDASLLNPTATGRPAQQGSPQPSSQTGSPGGLTLPPLRMAIDERNGSAQSPNGMSGGASPSGYGRTSPRVVSDGGQSVDGPSQGEDARQLGELGKRVAL